MDPQQRLLLEQGYLGLHASGLERQTVDGGLTGVFVGIMAGDFADMFCDLPTSVYSATGSGHAVASGRISFALGLHGPCASYDTACSASLVAGHVACRAGQLNECTSGLLLGVNLILLPRKCRTMLLLA